MKKLIRPIIAGFILTAVGAGIFTACQDEAIKSDGAGSGAAVMASNVVDLGLAGGPDGGPDANGNVLVNRNVLLDKDTCYIINNYYRIQSGFTITIEAGTVIRGAQGGGLVPPPPGTLVIERGAQIIANGTATDPIIFTSNQPVASVAPGDWGGVVILGNAPVNIAAGRGASPAPSNGVGAIEGLRFGNQGLYGGNQPTDNSGSLQYVRIEYAGDEVSTDNELNGLTLGGVGSGTTINHVIVAFGDDDGFEWFGGTVNASYLVAYRNRDDDYDTDQGFSGKVQFGLSIRCTDTNLAGFPVNGFESNGDLQDAYDLSWLTSVKFANFTVIGPVRQGGGSVDPDYNSGIHLRDQSALGLYNSLVVGYPNLQIQDQNGLGTFLGNVVVAPLGSPALPATNVTGFTTNNQQYRATASSGTGSLFNLSSLTADAWVCPDCEVSTIPNFTPANQLRPLINRGDVPPAQVIPAYTNLASVDAAFTTTQFVGAFNPSGSNTAWATSSNWWNNLRPYCQGPCVLD